MYKKFFIVACILIAAFDAVAQNLPVPTNILACYENGTRSEDGKPGKHYWQNTATYSLNIHFNPFTRLLDGTETIKYVNNSPDTLSEVWFKLYPNLYKKGAPRDQEIDGDDVSGGINISAMTINDVIQDVAAIKVTGTNMNVSVPPILPGHAADFNLSFSYTLNKGSHIRTGEIDPGSDFVAYFFPRIAVYDDIDGWNKYPYTGTQEFYNDFCNFNVDITVPRGFVVWASGNLLNCNEVLKSTYCNRLTQAEKTDGITTVIDTTDLHAKNITADNDMNTWKFEADNVTDFVFAASDHYIWKSSSVVVDKSTGRRTRVDAVFNPAHKDYYDVINQARATVMHMSYDFPAWPYPYPHETVFDGLDQMEYPMMVNDNPLENREDAIELTDHEIFHTMFPFYMGVNETKYAWMDEGWATIGEWLISPMIDTTILDEYGVKSYANTAGEEIDLPIKTLSTQQTGTAYFLNSYPKPAFGYLFVKDLLGDEVFTRALHYYIQEWHGKHPMPLDFFNCMNEGSGRNLNWFWERWFFDDGVPDLAIKKLVHSKSGYTATITMEGIKPVPVYLTAYFTDGSTMKIHRSIGVWEKSDRLQLSISSKKTVQKLVLGDPHVPDVDMTDNEYLVK